MEHEFIYRNHKERQEDLQEYHRPRKVSEKLQIFLGLGKYELISHCEARRSIFRYIKSNNLSNPLNKRYIDLDYKLIKLLDPQEQITYINIGKYIDLHFIKEAAKTQTDQSSKYKNAKTQTDQIKDADKLIDKIWRMIKILDDDFLSNASDSEELEKINEFIDELTDVLEAETDEYDWIYDKSTGMWVHVDWHDILNLNCC